MSERTRLNILDRPMRVFPGQTFRIAPEQPPGSGDLHVDVPETLTLFDTWRQDTIQRFYFRALKTGDAALDFRGPAGTLELPLEIIPWSDVFTPRRWENKQLPRIWPLDDPACREMKSRRTLHTPAELEALKERDPGPLARQWHQLTDEEVFHIIPGPGVPRTCQMSLRVSEAAQGKGCPVCGMKVYEGRHSIYAWRLDPDRHPWKVGCPSCGTWFPSNDFQNGDMHSGDFPDDGFGCEPAQPVLAPDGKPWRWPFIAYYRSGKGDRQAALWLRYGRAVQHAHADMLTFGLEALQRKLLPELGYPQGWTYSTLWEQSWGAHYGTHITGVKSTHFGGGRLTLFADSAPARIAVAESAAGESGWRQRTIVLVDLPDGACYAVTLERVRGGQSHLHSFHGPEGEMTSSGLDLHLQIHNSAGSHASYLVQEIRPVEDGCEITLNLNPQIGEGIVESCEDGALISHVRLRMAALPGYYAGKTLTNENGSTVYRLCDAVAVCLPHSLHAEASLAALDAGLHILVEKPLAVSIREADVMVARAERAHRKEPYIVPHPAKLPGRMVLHRIREPRRPLQ